MFIKQLKYLVTLAEIGHFSRAAEACHVSQPALSTAIRNLEKELELSLVLRGRSYEGLTPEGERVVGWAQRLLSSYEAMRQETVSAHKNLSGTLRIGAIPTTAPVVPLLTSPCLQQHPGIHVTMLSLPSDEIVRRLDNFDLDIGVTFLDDKLLAGFRTFPLFVERYVLAASDPTMFRKKKSVTWTEIAELPLCLLTGNMQSRRIIDTAFRQAGVKPRICVEADSMFALYAQLRSSRLCTIVPHSALHRAGLPDDITALPITPTLSREIGLVVRKQTPYPPVTSAALDAALQVPLQEYFDKLIDA